MKKIKSLLLLIFVLQNLIFSQAFHEKLSQKLVPLQKNEIIECKYDANTMILSIYKSINNSDSIYESIDYLDWNNWQLSSDRKKIIYWERWSNYDDAELPNFYLLDGNTGKTTFLGKNHEGYTSSDLKYLIFKKTYENMGIKFNVLNLETNEIEKELEWKIKSENYFITEENTLYVFRSLNSEFDYHLYIVSPTNYIFAEGYVNVTLGIIETIPNNGNKKKLDFSNISRCELFN